MTRRQQLLVLTGAALGVATAYTAAYALATTIARYGPRLAAAAGQHGSFAEQAGDTLAVGVPAVAVLCGVIVGAGWLRKAVRR